MTFEKIVKTFALSAVLAFAGTSANAQDLIARQAPVDRRATSIDTIVINRLQEAEEAESPRPCYTMTGTQREHIVQEHFQMFSE